MDSNKLKCKNTKEYIYKLANNNLCNMTISPKLAIVYIGNNKASEIYIKHKTKACDQFNINYEIYQLIIID